MGGLNIQELLLKGTEVAENLTLVLKESQGKQTSVIVPVDFVTAGGDSADCCPTWRWPTEGEHEGIPPSRKQSSITKMESCYPWCPPMEHSRESDTVTEEDGGDVGRVDPSPSKGTAGITKAGAEITRESKVSMKLRVCSISWEAGEEEEERKLKIM